MGKKYACKKCKKDEFRSTFALTKHVRLCLQGKVQGGGGACPECGKVVKGGGALGAHRRAKHKVQGVSRWAVRSMKMRADSRRRLGTDGLDLAVNALLDKAKWHEGEALRLRSLAGQVGGT